MHPLTETEIRESLINASQRERKALTLPSDFDTLAWDKLSYLGWRDRKAPSTGYIVASFEEGPLGVIVRQAEGKIRSRAQCSWCEDVQLPNDVVLFSAKRTGQRGRNGDTVGILACANFECSTNVRKLPPLAYVGFDAKAARQRRIETLGENVRGFVTSLRDGL